MPFRPCWRRCNNVFVRGTVKAHGTLKAPASTVYNGGMLIGQNPIRRSNVARAHRRARRQNRTRDFKTCIQRRRLCAALASHGKPRCKRGHDYEVAQVVMDYTFGHDEIAQRVVERDNATPTPNVISDTTHVFGHDGHGSVRALYDLAGTAANIAQAFTFAAYGEMLAVHNHLAASIALSESKTSLGYSGEHFDAKAQQQYLRARFYNPANGRFNRLDPFAGNMRDPQSLHKYAYVHGDPIGLVDPSGYAAECNGSPFPCRLGRDVHDMIEADYRAWGIRNGKQVLVEPYNTSFQNAIRPDLLNFSDFAVGEIKPFTRIEIAKGYAKLLASRNLLNGVTTTYLGKQIVPNGPLPDPNGKLQKWRYETWSPGIKAYFPGSLDPSLRSNVAVTLGNWNGLVVYKSFRKRNRDIREVFALEAVAEAERIVSLADVNGNGLLVGNEIAIAESQFAYFTINTEVAVLVGVVAFAYGGAQLGSRVSFATMLSMMGLT